MIEFIIGPFIRSIVVPLANRFAEFAAPVFSFAKCACKEIFSPLHHPIRSFSSRLEPRTGITSLVYVLVNIVELSCCCVNRKLTENNGIRLFSETTPAGRSNVVIFFSFFTEIILYGCNIEINREERKIFHTNYCFRDIFNRIR